MTKIKVLHLIKTLNLGGAETNLFNLVRAINSECFEIHIGYSLGGELEKRFKENGIKLFKFAQRNCKIKSFASIAIILRLVIYILKNRIQILQTHSFNAHIWGVIAARLTKARIIEHVHDFRYLEPDDYKRRRGTVTQYKYIKLFKKMSDIVIVLTKQNYDFLLQNKFCGKNQVRRIQNGIPILAEMDYNKELKKTLKNKLNILEDYSVILASCRIVPEKNIDLIFRIAPIVKRENLNVVFIISGNGPLFEKFKLECKELKLDDTIKMIGFYPQIHELLSITDIFLSPSFLELHSIAMLEALSVKVPVVVSKNVGCNEEFINNWENGVLLDPFSDAGWAEAIIKLLKDGKLRTRLGEKGYETCVENFDIKNVARKIENIYVELARK